MAALSSLLAGVQQSGEQLRHGLGPQLLRLYAVVLQPRYAPWPITQAPHEPAALLEYVDGLAACAGYASTLDQEQELSDVLTFLITAADTTLSALSAAGAGAPGAGCRRAGCACACVKWSAGCQALLSFAHQRPPSHLN